MFIERKFYGTLPALFAHFITISLVLNSAASLLVLFTNLFFIPLILLPLLYLTFRWIMASQIRWVHFRKDSVSVKYVFGTEEILPYDNFQKLSVKFNGIRKSVWTIHFIGLNKKIRKANIVAKGLDHQKFKAELIELKRLNAEA